VIKGNACAYLRLLGVACPPIISVSLEEVGCEPVLNLSATPDEAVSIMYRLLTKVYFQLTGEKLIYLNYTTDRPWCSVGHPTGALV
jgi:hypothetical protein